MRQYIKYPIFDFSQRYYKNNKSDKFEIKYYLNFISGKRNFVNINGVNYEYQKR